MEELNCTECALFLVDQGSYNPKNGSVTALCLEGVWSTSMSERNRDKRRFLKLIKTANGCAYFALPTSLVKKPTIRPQFKLLLFAWAVMAIVISVVYLLGGR